MRFDWNERKREANIRKHGLDFLDAKEMFDGPMLIRLDTRVDYGEDRWIGIGFSCARILVVAWTERNEEETLWIISLRKAVRHERKNFEKFIED